MGSMGTNILLASLLLGLLPIFMIGAISITTLTGSLESQVEDTLGIIAEAREEALLTHLDSMKSRTLDYSSDGYIRDGLKGILENGTGAEALNEHLLRNKLPLDRSLAGIFIIDLNGTVVASTDPGIIGSSEFGSHTATAGLYSPQLTVDKGTHRHFGLAESYIVAAPLTDRETGKPLGTIVNTFSTAGTKHILTSGTAGENASGNIMPSTYLVYSDMELFANPEVSEGGEYLSDTPTVRACIENQTDFSGRYVNYKGIDVYGVSRCLPELGLTFITSAPATRVYAPVNRAFFLIGAISAFFAVTVILGALMVSKSITGSIGKLTEVIEQISTGKLDAEIEPELKQANDEIGDLARAFDRTLVSLKLAMRQTAPALKAESEGLKKALEEKEKAEERIREERDRARSYLEIAGTIIISIDREGKITLINGRGCEVLGYPREEIVGKNWFDEFIPEGQRAKLKAVHKKVFAGEMEGVADFKNTILTKGGERLIHWHNSSLRDAKGNIIASLSSGEDITGRNGAGTEKKGGGSRSKAKHARRPG